MFKFFSLTCTQLNLILFSSRVCFSLLCQSLYIVIASRNHSCTLALLSLCHGVFFRIAHCIIQRQSETCKERRSGIYKQRKITQSTQNFIPSDLIFFFSTRYLEKLTFRSVCHTLTLPFLCICICTSCVWRFKLFRRIELLQLFFLFLKILTLLKILYKCNY